MVKIGLQLRANLENIASFEPTVDCVWHLKLKCTSCGEETANWQAVEASNRAPLKKSRGRANLVIKCKLCSRENSMDVLNDELRPYEADKASEFFTVAAFECRGVTPIAFDARDGFSAKAEVSGTVFDELAFEGKEWGDYDEEGKQAVAIYDLDHRFVTMK